MTFPPALAQFGSDEMVLIELQGSLEVEGNNVGQTVGKLSVDNTTVRSITISQRISNQLLFDDVTEKTNSSHRIPFT